MRMDSSAVGTTGWDRGNGGGVAVPETGSCRSRAAGGWMAMVRVAVVFWSLGAVAGAGEDWFQFLGPRRDGTVTGTLGAWPKEGPRRAWAVEVGQGHSSPVVVSNRVLLFHRAGAEEVIDAWTLAEGKPLWRSALPATYRDDFGFDEGPRSTPAVAGDTVVALGADGRLRAVGVDDGTLRWTVDFRESLGADKGFFGFACSPLVVGGTIVVNAGGSGGAGIVGIELKTGRVRWKATSHEAGYSSPVAGDLGQGMRVYSFTREGLVSLEPVSGRVDHEFPWRSRMGASVNAAVPVLVGGGILVTASYGTGAVLVREGRDGFTKVWSGDDALSSHFPTPLPLGGALYGFHGRQEQKASLRCIDPRTGRVHWEKAGTGTGALLGGGRTLLALMESGELVLMAATQARYEELARAQVLGSGVRASPAYAGGRLLARDGRRLVCLTW